jgi:predicted restriction endonuclease
MTILNILNNNYQLIDAKNKITVADSWVANPNKVGSANGEAKLYVGARDVTQVRFFGGENFKIRCFILKEDLLRYLNDYKFEYEKPSHNYRAKERLKLLWQKRYKKVNSLDNIIYFDLCEQTQIEGNRLYINSFDEGKHSYNLIRELALPNISYLSIIKLLDFANNTVFYFKLYSDIIDFFGKYDDPRDKLELEKLDLIVIENKIDVTEKEQLIKARIGQGKFRKQILDECPFCPITLVDDQSLLIASHIKPWRDSNNNEKLDPKNGFLFTPTFDTLFDKGLISFTNDKTLLVSSLLSSDNLNRLNICEGKQYPKLPIEKRKHYLDYHRNQIFKKY